MRNDLVVFAIEPSISNEDLLDLMVGGYMHCLTNPKYGCFMTIDGYDDDPRSLYEIPESKQLCQRMTDMGFLSVLQPSTMLDETFSDDSLLGSMPFGAFEVWAIATGLLNKVGQIEVTQDMLNKFWGLIHNSNVLCTATCKPLLGKFNQDAIQPGCYRHGSLKFRK